jgi:2-oxoglutarate ferredoxin oxidoreductase subunit delta
MKATDEKPARAPRAPQVALDRDLCKVCGICIALCPEAVFDRDSQGYPVVARPNDCTSCLLCELHCPDFALEVRRRPKRHPKAGGDVTPESIAEAHGERVKAALAGGSAKAGDGEIEADAGYRCHDEEG